MYWALDFLLSRRHSHLLLRRRVDFAIFFGYYDVNKDKLYVNCNENYDCVISPSDPITRSVAPSHLPLPAVPMSATATTLPTTRRLGWGCQWVAGRALATAATPNTSTTWTSTQTLTHTLHPPRPDPSICQLRKAALHPLLQSVPTSTYVPLLPLPALTLHDPQQPGTPVRKKGMKSASYKDFISAD